MLCSRVYKLGVLRLGLESHYRRQRTEKLSLTDSSVNDTVCKIDNGDNQYRGIRHRCVSAVALHRVWLLELRNMHCVPFLGSECSASDVYIRSA